MSQVRAIRWAHCLTLGVLLLALPGCGTDTAKVFEEAEAAREMGLHDAALERYLQLQQSAAESFPELDEKIGDVYAAKGDSAAALSAWAAALEKAPNSSRLWEKRGSFLMHSGQREEGYKALSRAVQLDNKSHTAHLNLGVSNLQDRQLPEALTHLAKAAELAPENPTVLKTLGVALLTAGRMEEGAVSLYAAWKKDKAVFAASKLFQLLVRTKRWTEAAEVGAVASEEDSTPETLVEYADALIRSGDGAKGSRIYQALERMELSPALTVRVRRVMEASRKLAAQVEAGSTPAPAPAATRAP